MDTSVLISSAHFFKILSADDNEKLLRLRVYRCIAFLERERRGRREEGEREAESERWV